VLIMIEGHSLDSWTRVSDRARDGYQWAIMLAGLGAPLFLFLAGVAIPLAAGSRLQKGLSPSQVTWVAVRRGAFIFALALLFRLQSMLLSGGTFDSLLKVDILNVMGVSMMVAALLWGAGHGPASRAAIYLLATVVIAMATPLVRAASWLDAVANPIEAYLRPSPGSTTFTLFPWAGFLTAGAGFGCWLEVLRSPASERRGVGAMTLVGVLIAAGGYAASFLPPLYEHTSFWTSSPTFFAVRLGLVAASVGLGYAAANAWGGRLLQEFGRASLFIYWIHVEMAYGIISLPLHRRLPFEAALVALVAFAALLFGIVRLRDRVIPYGRLPEGRNHEEARLRPAETQVP
jgi:uncharacterized membrane protein